MPDLGIGDLLLRLGGNKSPSDEIVRGMLNDPQDTPVSPSSNDPDSFKSPPDFASLYSKMLKRDRRTGRIDSGLAMLAAGLSGERPSQALLQNAATPSPPGVNFESLMALRNDQLSLNNRQRLLQSLPSVAKELQLPEHIVHAYHAAGVLPDIIKEREQVFADEGNYRFYVDDAESRGETPDSFTDWLIKTKKAGATSVNVNTAAEDSMYGEPPKDMVWARDEQGKVVTELDPRTMAYRPVALPVRGGSVDLEAQDKQLKLSRRRDNAIANAESVVGEVRRGMELLTGAPIRSTGLVGAALKRIPSTDASQLAQVAESIGSNVSIDKLNAIREGNDTGGALGQVPVKQQQLLSAMLGSLDTTQKPDFLLYTLQRIHNVYMDTIFGRGGWENIHGERFDLPFDANAKKFAEGYDYRHITEGELRSLSAEERAAFTATLDDVQYAELIKRIKRGE